ncbi:MAG: response regulator transcription factor [Clostridiales bacterium]|nr:response regulator transcription factor [Clostridiales bacterium]
MYKIFIVEDDMTISALLKENLIKWGYYAYCVEDFNAVIEKFNEVKPHLVLLDVSLPYYNGYYFCGEIRKLSNTPIIFISSHNENMDMVMAINMGADDYITKPFSLDVVIAKISAILRRTYSYYSEKNMLEVKGVILNTNDASISINGENISLTKNEFKILSLLIENKNNIVTREDIMKKLWDSEAFVDDNTLTVNINRLRKKLEENGAKDFIETKKGLGYIIND